MLLEKIRRRTTCSAALRWARWNVERVGISALLADRPSDAIRPQPYDLWNLYRTVRWRTPRVTMEFGVGCSTIAIAAALHRNGSGRHIVVEANERWLEASRQELPSHLRNIVTYVHSRVQKIGHNDGTCHVFTDRPDVMPDLLYVDGPNTDDVPGWPQELPPIAGDPVYMTFPEGALILVDSRVMNVAFLRRNLTVRYKFSRNEIFGVSRFHLA